VIWFRRKALESAIDDWSARGLIDDAGASRLIDDLNSAKRGFTFNTFVILAGIICLGFGAISFIAANWDVIPRLARVGIIFGAMWAAWAGAFWAAWRRHPWVYECLILLACILYGASIMLIAQLYHIQGSAEDAVLMWAVGTLIGAVLTRSGLALALVFMLLAIWHTMAIGGYPYDDINTFYLLWLGIASIAAWWVRSSFSAHLATLSLVYWAFTTLAIRELDPTDLAWCAVIAMAVMIAALVSAQGPRILRGFESGLVVYMVLFFGILTLTLLAVSDATFRDDKIAPAWVIALTALPVLLAAFAWQRKIETAYDAWIAAAMGAGFIVVFTLFLNPWLQSAFSLAAFIWVPRLGWRLESQPIRVLGMIGFAAAMLIVYAVTVGSLIGTSGFYIGAGVILITGAWVGNRLGRGRAEGAT
jgi:uncharacterized membrane protein